MAPRRLVTWQEFNALELELVNAEVDEARLVRTCTTVNEFVGYRPAAEPAHIRMSFFMQPCAYRRRRVSPNAHAFHYGEIGPLGSMAVELMMDDHAGTASSFFMTIKDKWPRLYKSVAEYEFPELLAGAEVKDSRIYDRIFDAIAKLKTNYLVTHKPPTSFDGSKYSLSEDDRRKVITLGC